jgi:hypothetical protein
VFIPSIPTVLYFNLTNIYCVILCRIPERNRKQLLLKFLSRIKHHNFSQRPGKVTTSSKGCWTMWGLTKQNPSNSCSQSVWGASVVPITEITEASQGRTLLHSLSLCPLISCWCLLLPQIGRQNQSDRSTGSILLTSLEMEYAKDKRVQRLNTEFQEWIKVITTMKPYSVKCCGRYCRYRG